MSDGELANLHEPNLDLEAVGDLRRLILYCGDDG